MRTTKENLNSTLEYKFEFYIKKLLQKSYWWTQIRDLVFYRIDHINIYTSLKKCQKTGVVVLVFPLVLYKYALNGRCMHGVVLLLQSRYPILFIDLLPSQSRHYMLRGNIHHFIKNQVRNWINFRPSELYQRVGWKYKQKAQAEKIMSPIEIYFHEHCLSHQLYT